MWAFFFCPYLIKSVGADTGCLPVVSRLSSAHGCLILCVCARVLVVVVTVTSSRTGRFFYRMVEGSVPQWILTHPMGKAPRTGDGLFPGEVIEVTQVSQVSFTRRLFSDS